MIVRFLTENFDENLCLIFFDVCWIFFVKDDYKVINASLNANSYHISSYSGKRTANLGI